MVETRSKRKLLQSDPKSPEQDLGDETISADNFSPTKKAKMSSHGIGESSCNWHTTHEEVLIDLMEEEFYMGRMGANNTFSPKQFNEFAIRLKDRTGRAYEPLQVKAKFTRMKAKSNAFAKLINTTGFGWSPETNTVTAEEDVWTTYLKANPGASVFRNKGLLGFDKLHKIFRNSTATGLFGQASTQGPPNSDEERNLGGGPMDDAHVRGSGGRRSSKRSISSLDALIETMSETSRTKKAHYDAKATYMEEHSMADCMTVLATMPVSEEQYALAAERLISGKDWRTFFLLSPPERQFKWVNGLK